MVGIDVIVNICGIVGCIMVITSDGGTVIDGSTNPTFDALIVANVNVIGGQTAYHRELGEIKIFVNFAKPCIYHSLQSVTLNLKFHGRVNCCPLCVLLTLINSLCSSLSLSVARLASNLKERASSGGGSGLLAPAVHSIERV